MNKENAVQLAQMRQLFAASSVSLIFSMILAAVLGYMLRGVVAFPVITTWFFVIVVSAMSRFILIKFVYLPSSTSQKEDSQVWLTRFRLLVLFAGLAWGAAGIVLFPAHNSLLQLVMVMVLSGLVSGAVVSFSADRVCASIFPMTVMLPLMTSLFLDGDNLARLMGLTVLLYFFFMTINILRINRNIRENVILHIEASEREEQVRASEERYRLLLSHSPVGIFHYDSDLIITYCNHRLADIMGSFIKSYVGIDLKLLNDQSLMPALSLPLQGEMGYYDGYYHATHSAAERWIEMTCAPFLNAAGRSIGGIAIIQDITNRRLAELRDQWQVKVLEQLAKGETLPIVLNTIIYGVEQIHPGMLCSILLLNEDGKHLTVFAAPSLPDLYIKAIESREIAPDAGGCCTVSFNGERIIIEDIQAYPDWPDFKKLAAKAGLASYWSEPIKDGTGKVLGTFAIFHRTPRSPSQEDIVLITQSSNLAKLTIERKKGEAAIFDAKEKAEALAQSKSEFLANMSHEIRTPMNAIIGLSELALNQHASDEVRDYLEKINVSSENLLGILNDILVFSKMEAGKLSIDHEHFNLQVMLENLRNLFAVSADNKRLELCFEVEEGIPQTLIGDALRVRQVLSNLLGNAIKFTSQGKVAVKVKVHHLSSTTITLGLSVSDTGIGITQKEQAHLFQPFSQADTSITRRFGGTGLGLAISQQLLHLMDSNLHIESTPGQGAEFSFELKLGVAAEQSLEASAPRTLRQPGWLSDELSQRGSQLQGKHILIAEDNIFNQKVIEQLLKLCGMSVDIANNGLEVLQKLEQHQYDAILMDMQMPEMSGAEATEAIRQQSQYDHLPIIALTAGVTQEDRDKSITCGMNDFLSKPVNPQELITLLNLWVAKAQGAIY